ncbi:hypothetical protein QQP08_005183 [Theobroma cacao]|nr:hypothetical protein QQP08_005183 [Theobroma cacao]
MSTDLELFQDLTKIKLPQLKIQSSNGSGAVIQQENNNQDSSNECTTPTSEESKIPAALKCPPAPKKPKRRTVSCKRKLSDQLQFFEIVNREEVEAYLKAGFDSSKRRNISTMGFKIEKRKE